MTAIGNNSLHKSQASTLDELINLMHKKAAETLPQATRAPEKQVKPDERAITYSFGSRGVVNDLF